MRASGPPDRAAVLRSTNRGKSWKLLATIKAGHDLQEVTVAERSDGQLVMMARPEGDICGQAITDTPGRHP